MNNSSFQLLRTNTRITSNVKLVVSSDGKMYLESFDTNKQLSSDVYKHYLLDKEVSYDYSLAKYYDGIDSQIVFDVKYDGDNKNVYSTYDKQFDDMYWSGSRDIEDNWYNESHEYFAPLYINKDKLPDGFVILRVDGPVPYEEKDNQYVVTELRRNNFESQIVDKWKVASFVDMRYQSNIGYYISKNIIENTLFPTSPLEVDFRESEFVKWYGIDYKVGSYAAKSRYMKDILYYEQPHFKLEQQITNAYKENNMVFPNIWNLKFLFDDMPSTPDKKNTYSVNRYYGFYVDDLEFVMNLTSYVTPELKIGISIQNNIFMYGTEEMIESPFVEGFDITKQYYIQWNNVLNEVVKVRTDEGKYVYKIISNEDLTGVNITNATINENACFISYQEGNYECLTYDNPSGYTNLIKGYKDSFIIDPYVYKQTTSDPIEIRDMYADLYLILIDDVYHVLKKRGDDYFVQTDYAINSYPEYLEYWTGGDYKLKNTEVDSTYTYKLNNEYGVSPIVYPVYRIKFSDIKDFDFDRVDTKFADFDYEKDSYYVTTEQKLYAVDYLNLSIEKQFRIHPRGDEAQYQIMNISSEYVAGDELYEIKNDDLTEIWRKNQFINKWGFIGSNSHADYPYKLNNSISVGDNFNRTTDVFSLAPNETSKNLDYFYRIGHFFDGNPSSPIRYLNQNTNIETDLMNQGFSSKFNLEAYLSTDVDYFDYFFKNKMIYELDGDEYVKDTNKYSLFTGGDKYNNSTTIFNGINFDVVGLENVTRDTSDKITDFISNGNSYNGYKFAIILNDVYQYEDSGSFVLENGLMNNNVIDKNSNSIHIFLNDKFENILCVVNTKISFISYNSMQNFNNVELFGEKFGLYEGKTLEGGKISLNNIYNPYLLTASNFIDATSDLNNNYDFDSGVTYYYIANDGQTGSTVMNDHRNNNTMSLIDTWGKNFPPFVLTINDPKLLKTKLSSYNKEAIKGPFTNIYDKYSTYYDDKKSEKVDVKEPLARTMSVDQDDHINYNVRHGEQILVNNDIYRYNGRYEPIFKNIQIFNVTDIYNSVYEYEVDNRDYLRYWGSNYKFDYSYSKFGTIDELIYSKVSPKDNPLKLRYSSDNSIYPMVDEFGYTYSSRFIFSSGWDKNFYVLTKPDQIKISKKIKLSAKSDVSKDAPAFTA